jgi:hypothetical protein
MVWNLGPHLDEAAQVLGALEEALQWPRPTLHSVLTFHLSLLLPPSVRVPSLLFYFLLRLWYDAVPASRSSGGNSLRGRLKEGSGGLSCHESSDAF